MLIIIPPSDVIFAADIQKKEREENCIRARRHKQKSYAEGNHVTLVISVWVLCLSSCMQQRQSSPQCFVFVCSLFVLHGFSCRRQDCTERALRRGGGWINKVRVCGVFWIRSLLITLVLVMEAHGVILDPGLCSVYILAPCRVVCWCAWEQTACTEGHDTSLTALLHTLLTR